MLENRDIFQPRQLHWICHDRVIEEGIIAGGTDVGIHPSPRSRYELIRKRLPDSPETEWYRDSTRRAQQTSARIFAERDWEVSEQLHPRAMGLWEGRTWESIRAEDAVRAEAWWTHFEDTRAPGDSESVHQAMERADAFLTGMGHRTGWTDAVVVAPPEIIAAAVCSILGVSPRAMLRFAIDPLSLTTVRHTWIGWQLGSLNQVS